MVAIGFSYFEKLVDAADTDQVAGEVARLTSMNPLLASVGGYDYYEDWADEYIGLLRELTDCVTDEPKARALIHERWTDTATASALIYYLRLLGATYLKANAEKYDPFVPDGQGIQVYCNHNVEIPDKEIEQLGIIALVHCLLQPVDIVLEIAYLDRSPGSTVNEYRFPEEMNDKDISTLGPVINLLYRPDHYDILYRRTASAQPSQDANAAPVTMQVNRATGLYSHTPITSTHGSLGTFSTANFGLLASLPSAPGASSSLAAPETANPSSAPWIRPAQGGAATPPPEPECNIRFTTQQYDYDEDSKHSGDGPRRPFHVTTNTFKNSVWNRAHFGNPEFRPEQWCPEDEHMDGRMVSRRKRMSKDP